MSQWQKIHDCLGEAIFGLFLVSQGSLFCFLDSIPIVTEFKLIKLCLNDKTNLLAVPRHIQFSSVQTRSLNFCHSTFDLKAVRTRRKTTLKDSVKPTNTVSMGFSGICIA